MKKQFAAILTFFVCFAPPVLAGGFSVATDGPVIRLNEIVVVGADGLDLATGETGATVANGLADLKADQTAAMPESKAGWSGNISFGSLFGDGRWAREVAARDDVAEITLAALLPSRDYGATVRQARYCISIPVATLKGASFEYRLGMHRSGRAKRTGKLTGDEAEGEFIATHIRHIQFTGGKVDLFVDFCPCGVWGIFLEDPATAYKAHLKRQGDQYVFVIPNRAARYGTRLVNKVVLRAGKHDMDRLHPVRAVHYTSPFPVFKRVQFVARFPVKGLSTR
ncbi:MAG: hypothetical protein KAI66_15315, partial [Lentisphaeria bacterium]|nr:hypothetical protein [Lentisphaeria bacterium]